MNLVQITRRRLCLAHVLAGAVLLAVVGVSAQPRGPRDVITGARKAGQERQMRRAIEATEASSPAPAAGLAGAAAQPGAQPPTAAAEPSQSPSPAAAGPASANPHGANPHGADPHGANPHGANPHGADPHGAGLSARRKPLSEARENPGLPPGSLRVRVVDGLDRPLANTDFRVGVLKSDGSRVESGHKTDQLGVAVVAGLPVGDKQAYRVEVKADGASFSSTPFRMPHVSGYEVLVRRLPTTRSQDELVLYVGAVSVELKEDRLKIAQQLRLINVGASVFVFPESGLPIALPKGFTAFQAQDSMGDQRAVSTDTGLSIEGSIPPGQVTMLWGFDVPIDGTEMTIELPNPFTTYAYRVLADAAPGLSLHVDGLPPAELHENEGGRYWLTEAARKPEQGPLRQLRIVLKGIPGPGPARWIAAGLALILLGGGYLVSRRLVVAQDTMAATAERRDALLQQVRLLQQDFDDGEVGPEYFADEKARLTDALATVLWEQAQHKSA